jgi:hypothetical protein
VPQWQHLFKLAAASADMAAEMVQGPQPYALSRGAGMLMLLADSWGGKAVQLQAGRALVGEQHFTHYSIVQQQEYCCSRVHRLCRSLWQQSF